MNSRETELERPRWCEPVWFHLGVALSAVNARVGFIDVLARLAYALGG